MINPRDDFISLDKHMVDDSMLAVWVFQLDGDLPSLFALALDLIT